MGKLFPKTANPFQRVIRSFSHVNRKKMILLSSLILVLSLSFTGYVLSKEKKITLIVDGQTKTIETSQKNVEGLLLEQKIKVESYDQLSTPIDSKLKDGITIEITHAVPINLAIANETKEVFTTGKTVADLLKQEKVTLGEFDKIEPILESPITPNMDIVVTRVEKKVVQKEETVSFGFVRKADSTLPKGKEKVITKGKQGKVVKSIEVIYENGKEVAQNLIKQEIIESKNDQIVAYGTRVENPTISRGGLSFRPRTVLTNVKVTQYTGGTHTYTGTTPTPGRTIAVDPNVIPLGWWVYIEGFGYRRAEDVGGAVKGKMVDIYVKDRSAAISYGLRYGYKVYVIGPNKPN